MILRMPPEPDWWVGFMLQVGPLMAAAIWAVATIKGTTAKLGMNLEHLAGSINRLETILEVLRSDQQELKTRVAVLEDRRDRIGFDTDHGGEAETHR